MIIANILCIVRYLIKNSFYSTMNEKTVSGLNVSARLEQPTHLYFSQPETPFTQQHLQSHYSDCSSAPELAFVSFKVDLRQCRRWYTKSL